MVDAEDFLLAVALVPGSVQDHHALPALGLGNRAWPSLRLAVLDGVLAAEHCRLWSNLHGVQHDVVRRPPGPKGFAALRRR